MLLSKKNEEKWLVQFEKLKKYNQQHGNCNVPSRYKEEPSLGYWVTNQRKAYHSEKLSKEHVKQLESIGFQWQLKKMPAHLRNVK